MKELKGREANQVACGLKRLEERLPRSGLQMLTPSIGKFRLKVAGFVGDLSD